MPRFVLAALAAVALQACTVTAKDSIGPGPTQPPPPGAGPASCGATTGRRVRRLSITEYLTVMRDLIGDDVPLLVSIPPDPRAGGFDNNADKLSVNAGVIAHFTDVAEQVAAALPVDRLAPCGSGRAAGDCARSFATTFARRAYGRPLSADEAARLQNLFDDAAATDGYPAGIRLMAEAILQSPHFLYRTELGRQAQNHGPVALSPYEVASQLSFLVTGARPDDRLLDLADAGKLAFPDVLKSEALRLLETPRARVHLRRFLIAWLGLEDLDRLTKSNEFFPPPDFTPVIRDEMKLEIDRFLDHALGEGGGTLDALFGTSESFVTPLLASIIYKGDVLGPVGSGATLVKLDPRHRRGILSLPGFLAVHATVARTSPVDRGVFVLRRLLCQDIPDPPPGVFIPPLASPDRVRTTRQNQDDHARSPNCAACHVLIDPIGFGFEHMDGIGRFRTNEGGPAIDSSGRLNGTDVDGPFAGPAELTGKLLASRMVRACFVNHLWRWSEARDVKEGDGCALDDHLNNWLRSDGGIADLLVQFTTSARFTTRKAQP